MKSPNTWGLPSTLPPETSHGPAIGQINQNHKKRVELLLKEIKGLYVRSSLGFLLLQAWIQGPFLGMSPQVFID